MSDKRQPINFYLSILVDVGVTYKRALGDEAAQRFFAQQQVPGNIAARIMSTNPARRLTDWEKNSQHALLQRTAAARDTPS